MSTMITKPRIGDSFGVMYHYINSEDDRKSTNDLDIDIFRKQLDFFSETYGIYTKEEWEARISGDLVAGKCLLTFDDGLIDHYNYVLPELKKRGLFAIFAISSQSSASDIQNVHLLHYLLANFDQSLVFDIFKDLFSNKDFKYLVDLSNSDRRYLHQKQDYRANTLKIILNHILSYGEAKKYLELVCTVIDKEVDKNLIQNWYMQDSHISEIINYGCKIASHGKTHSNLANLNDNQLTDEIVGSKIEIEKQYSIDINEFVIPYGDNKSYTNGTESIILSAGYAAIHVYNESVHHANQAKNTLQKFSRFDCNNFVDI